MLETTHKVVSFTREELYEQVWATPMSRLAGKYGISNVGLAKICRKYDIPCPPRGYWAKLRNGQSPRKTRLPNSNEGTKISLYECPEGATPKQQDARIVGAASEHQGIEFHVVVRDNLRGAHGLVSQANEILGGARADDNGLL